MIQFRCPGCQKLLQVGPENAGKLVACPCGQQSRVPAGSDSGQTPDPYQPPAPQSPFGGPGAFDAPGDFPPPNQQANPHSHLPPSVGVGQPSPYSADQQTPYPGAQQSPFSPDSQAPFQSAGGAAGNYMADTDPSMGVGGANEYAPPKKTPFNSTTLAGVGMMVGAAVWFFVGLAAGVTFLYPPILFIFGLVSFFKGLFGGGE